MGWFGLRSEVINVLGGMMADRSENGCLMVRGPIYASLWPDELLLGDRAEYRVNGEWKNLADAMIESGCGRQANVIGY
ncbi:MAG: hypothetical protein AB1656_06150 [Candidatus Omnitrophota bacterium]